MTEQAAWLGPLLAESAIKATLVLAAALAASICLRGRSAAYRYTVWVLGVTGVLALPLLVVSAPSVPVPIVPASQRDAVPPVLRSAMSDRPAPAAAVRTTAAAGQHQPRIAIPTRPASRSIPSPVPSPASWWLIFWATGAVVVLGRYLLGIAAARRLVRLAQPLDTLVWEDRLLEAVARLELNYMPPLLISTGTPVPLTCGLRRPVLILPREARTWDAERSFVVLLHELAHVRRRDCVVQAMLQVACAVYWFHPLVWMAARRLRAERERACDDLVLAAGAEAPAYAEHLLGIARSARHQVPAAALAMARASELEGRLLAILDTTRSRAVLGVRTVARLAVPAALVIAVLAAVEPAPRAAVISQPLETMETAIASASPEAFASEPKPAARSADAQRPPAPAPAPTQTPTPAPQPAPADADDAAEQAVSEDVSKSVIKALTEALNDSDADVRRQALSALGRRGARVPFEALVTAARDQEADVRAEAVRQLAKRRDPQTIPMLTKALEDTSEEVRSHATHALGELRVREAIPALQQALTDKSEDVRHNAVFALSQLRATEAIPAVARALREDRSPDVREQAAFALSQFRDPSTVEPLVQALKDAHAGVREKAVFALAEIKDDSAVPAVIAALTDDHADVREQAAFALSQFRDPRAVEPLIGRLTDASPDVREKAAFALGELRDPRAIDALTAALKDKSADVREKAVWALSEIADRSTR
jgi:HEAT repeat protein/beta-lactamase regulating signal transducer with metallopeptidase domain